MFGYLRLQLRFLLLRLREVFERHAEPVPPPRLRHRVHGSTDVRGYLEVGRICWENIEALLRDAGADPDQCTTILDFGCGTGRVTRRIRRDLPQPRTLTGIDIDANAIAWCRRHLPGIRFIVGTPHPPLPFPDGAFDLVFAVSVFTHLDEAMQFAWLAEMQRVIRPGGFLIASVQGEHHRSLRRRPIDVSRGFAFVTGRTGLFKRDGLPDFYQDAQHTRSYVEREWSRFFRVAAYRDRGMAGHQDAVVLQRVPPPETGAADASAGAQRL